MSLSSWESSSRTLARSAMFRSRVPSCAWLAATFFLLLSEAAGWSHAATTRPAEDPDAVLHNPDMGWVVYENFPVDPDERGSSNMLTLPNENFDGVDNVAIMFSWADVETRPGEYDFSAVDRAYDFWNKRGKRIQLRMSTESLLWWNTRNPPRGTGIPPHVLHRLPPGSKQT